MRISLNVIRAVLAARTRALWDPPWGMLVLGIAAAAAMTTQVAAAAHPALPSTAASVAIAERPAPMAAGALTPADEALLARYGGNLEVLRAAGVGMLSQARNEATAGSFLTLPGVARLNAELEQAGQLLPSTDPAQLATAVGTLQTDSGLIHSELRDHGASRLIIVSLRDQRLVAYDHGRIVVDTPVTTGRPELSTDVGLMHVLSVNAPWTMKSPWHKGTPLWYPDTPVTSVAWFTTTGEGLHDAPWEPPSAFGPGSENGPYASHGCIHLPSAAQATLFAWVTVGTPVVVIPGDGSAADQQVAQQSVDARGNPVSGVRGL